MGKLDYTSEALAHLRSCGLNVNKVIFDGKSRRCPTRDRPDSKNGSYRAYMKDMPIAFWQNYRTGEGGVWTPKTGGKVSRQQQRAIERCIQKENKAKDKRQKAAAARAERLYSTGQKCRVHPYLKRKGVNPISGLKVDTNGGLLVPVRDAQGNLTSLQRIDVDGNKLFLRDGKIGESYFLVGKIKEDSVIVLVAEGLSTALSLHESTRHSVLVAFCAFNLPHVAKIARTFAPEAKIILCADNDIRDKDAGIPNTGVQYATLAALEVDGWLAVPHLKRKDLPVKCDFNDVHLRRGAKRVKKQLSRAEKPAGHLTRGDKLPPGYFSRFTGRLPGLWYTEYKDNGEPRDIYLGPAIHVLAVTRNESSKDWGLLLEWFDLDGKRHTWAMPKSLLIGDLASTWLMRIVDEGWAGPVRSKVRSRLIEYFISYRTTGEVPVPLPLRWGLFFSPCCSPCPAPIR